MPKPLTFHTSFNILKGHRQNALQYSRHICTWSTQTRTAVVMVCIRGMTVNTCSCTFFFSLHPLPGYRRLPPPTSPGCSAPGRAPATPIPPPFSLQKDINHITRDGMSQMEWGGMESDWMRWGGTIQGGGRENMNRDECISLIARQGTR